MQLRYALIGDTCEPHDFGHSKTLQFVVFEESHCTKHGTIAWWDLKELPRASDLRAEEEATAARLLPPRDLRARNAAD